MKRKMTVLILAVMLTIAMVGCVMVDTGLVGTWKNDTTDFTITLKNDGTATLGGVMGELVYALSLGSTIKYTASAGAGEWYFSSILLGDGSKTAFTYTLTGSKLTTNMFYETSDTAYTYTMQ